MKIKIQDFLASNIYLFIIISSISKLRDQLYQQESWSRVYKYSILIILILDFIYIAIDLISKSGKSNIWIIISFIFVSYELFISILNNLVPQSIVIDVLPWPFTFSVLLVYIKDFGTPVFFKPLTIIAIMLCCILSIPNIISHLYGYGRSGGVIFPIYYCFCYLGIVMRVCSKRITYFFMPFVTTLLFISTKRVGTLIVLGGIVIYFLSVIHLAGTLKARAKQFIGYFFAVASIIIIILVLINRYDVSTFERLSHVFEDEGSGRGFIWRTVMNSYVNSSLFQKIFGHGFHAVSLRLYIWDSARSMAHNSYMETLYDYGIIGLLMIIAFTIFLINSTWKMFHEKSENLPAMAYSIVGLIILGLFSYFFEQSVLIMVYVVLWAICIGDEMHSKKMLKK